MKLALGVNNVAYTDAEHQGVTTTGEVAEILEQEYDVMGVFLEIHGAEVMADVGKSMTAYLNSIFQGNPAKAENGLALGGVEEKFKDYLSADEWKSHTGRVIKAAQAGASARFKSGQSTDKKGKPNIRPAFIDTGLYSASFRAKLQS